MTETQRKRRSKNRLSNRRSTGFVSVEEVEQAKNIHENDQGWLNMTWTNEDSPMSRTYIVLGLTFYNIFR